ncbi:MAG: lysophospholipid acyltransferase family protein [Desulfotignum sp.]|nr:lysophospholipid acyltransferase family protein [Desulfotignum sp.]MCF8086517.1 lysophospholipid acyltransferase family protein [Desulfotignum sp.]MCF8135919.1 lysophospholipid acyltransferase family protein [Desulfotignum sp.]
MKDEQIYWLLKRAVSVLGYIPVPVADLFARILGQLWFRLDKRHRNITLDNLTWAFGHEWSEEKIEQTARQVFVNIASMLFEVAWSMKLSKSRFLSHFTIQGLEHVINAHARGKGVLVISGHMGNFEMLLPAIEGTGLKGYAIYRKLDFEPLEKMMRDLRQRFGVTMIPMRGASRKLEDILAAGGVVGTLIDQNVDWYKGVFVRFFDRPACTNSGLAKLAMKTHAPVVPLYTVRHGRHFFIRFLPEVPVTVTGDAIADIEANTQGFVTAVETMVRQYPDQYFWVHNRWKTKPWCLWPKQESR